MNVHVCNYASRFRMALCRRLVQDGERYCWQHAKRTATASSYADTVAACERYNAERRRKEGGA